MKSFIKFSLLGLAVLGLTGCEAVNRAKPSKPYGISRLKNPVQPKGEHFMKEFVADQANFNPPSQQNMSSTPATNMSHDRMAVLRAKYGLPHPDIIVEQDLKDMIRLYSEDALRLQKR
jgi:hypothetical protein